MLYCKDCAYLSGTKCFRPVDDPVRGENASLELDALYQRTEYSGEWKGPYYEYHNFCGLEAKYFKPKPETIEETIYWDEETQEI